MTEQRSTLIIEIDSRNAERNARNIARELQSIERTGDFATRSMDSMSVATRNLVGYMGGLVTIGAAVSKMDTYTGLQNRLKLVTTSQTELNTAMNDTFAIAQKTASSWDSTAMVYQRFADNADRLGISMKTTADLTETVSKAISVSGGSAASAEAALMQFGQALASGVLRGEEFNSIAEQAPGLLKAIAMGMDTNVGALRAMAAEGKITGDELVKALTKAKPYVDDLFGKTDFTIAQSFTQLSNEVTKFVGVAGTGSGAAAGLSGAISGLAENLGTIANVAVIGGVALLTKTILAQTVAIYGSVTATIQRRAVDLAALQSQVQLAAVEVQRTRGQVGALAAERNLIIARLQGNVTTAERIALETRATQVAIQLAVAERNMTAATAQRTAAQSALNASTAIGSRVLALVGGPIGAITLGVAGLAAGYMYLKSRTDEANAKLEEQGKIALETDESLKKLTGNDKINAVADLTSAFNAQNAELAKSKESVDAVLFAIRAASVENEKARKVTEDARNGVISYNQAIELLNKMDIPTDLYDMLKKQVIQYDENADKASNSQRVLKILGAEFKLSGNAAQNSAVQIEKNTTELAKNETAAQKAANAQKGFFDSLNQDVASSNERLAYMNLGFSKDVIDQINKLQEAKQKALGDGVTAIVTTEEINHIVQAQKALDAVEDKEDEITEAKRKQTKELEKQQKILQINSKVQALSEKYNISSRATAAGIPKGVIEAMIMQESKGRKNAEGPVTRNGDRAQGLAQFMPATARQYGVSVFNEESSINGMIKYMSVLIKQFGGDVDKAIMAYNAGPENVRTGKAYGFKETKGYLSNVKSYAAGTVGYAGTSKDFDKILEDATKLSEEQAKSRKSLEFDVANEVTKIRENLKDKLIEIDKAGFTPERTKELKAEYQTRADNEIAIAEYALKTKLDDYSSFRKTESELLEDSFREKKFYASRDIELSKSQRDQAVALLDEQLKHEQAMLILARETRIFQYKQAMMTETQIMQERYRLERAEILRTNDPKERAAKLSAFNETTIRGGVGKNFSDPNDTNSQFLKSVSYAAIPQTNMEKLDEEHAKVLQKLTDNLNAVRDAENASNEERLEAKRVFDEARQQSDDEYYFKAQDARKADHESQLQLYGQMLSQASGVWGDMTNMIGEYKEKNTKTYKTMFAAQQAFAIASAIVSAELAASKALELGPILGIPASNIVRALGYTSVGLIAAQAIAGPDGQGYFNGGYTGAGGKYEDAGRVHKGEVVWSQEDIKRWGGVGVVESMRLSSDTQRVGSAQIGAIDRQKTAAIAVQPKVTIINQTSQPVDAKSEWDGDELKVFLTDLQKKNEAQTKVLIAQSWRDAERQGGSLDRIKKGR